MVQAEICWILTSFELELLLLELYSDSQKKQEMIIQKIFFVSSQKISNLDV